MIVLIDMDGVIVDYNLAVHEKLVKKFGKILVKEEFYIKERYDKKYHRYIDLICNKKISLKN